MRYVALTPDPGETQFFCFILSRSLVFLDKVNVVGSDGFLPPGEGVDFKLVSSISVSAWGGDFP